MSDSEREIEEVYSDRNVLAVYLVKSRLQEDRTAGGWTDAPDAEDDWAIVWFETLFGEVSWHVPRGMAEKHLPRNGNRDYDGYGRDVKNDRVWTLIDDMR